MRGGPLLWPTPCPDVAGRVAAAVMQMKPAELMLATCRSRLISDEIVAPSKRTWSLAAMES